MFKRLDGVLHLVIELPEESPGTIPAAATDVLGSAEATGPAVVLDAAGVAAAAGARGGADRAGRSGPVTAAAGPAACSCELGRARRHLERAVTELEQARLAWGVWADGIRKLAEQRTGIGVADGRPRP